MNKERENRKSEEKERRTSKKSNGCTPSFYVDCLRGEFYFAFNVIEKSSSDIYSSYPYA